MGAFLSFSAAFPAFIGAEGGLRRLFATRNVDSYVVAVPNKNQRATTKRPNACDF